MFDITTISTQTPLTRPSMAILGHKYSSAVGLRMRYLGRDIGKGCMQGIYARDIYIGKLYREGIYGRDIWKTNPHPNVRSVR